MIYNVVLYLPSIVNFLSTLNIKTPYFSNTAIFLTNNALSFQFTNHIFLYNTYSYFKANSPKRNDKALLHVNINIIYTQNMYCHRDFEVFPHIIKINYLFKP